jgi:hypothetical protein
VQLTADIYPYILAIEPGVLYPKRNFADSAETEFVLAHVSRADDIIFNSFQHIPTTREDTGAGGALRGVSQTNAH